MTLALAAQSISAPVRDQLAATEDKLVELFSDPSTAVSDMSKQVTAYGGKRLRPILVHLCSKVSGTPNHEHVVIAAVVECLHMSSLMHDDVLDEGETRRQVTTLNALYGNQLPILMGDLIYTRAFHATLQLSSNRAAQLLCDAAEAICLGEIEQSFLRYTREYDKSRYYRVIELKTASLFGAACELGSHYAGGSEESSQALRRYGENLGMGFQIIDDCLDVIGDEGVVGKSLGTDLETGKVTLPIIRLADTLDDDGKDELREVLYGPTEESRRVLLQRTFDITDVVRSCQEEATEFVKQSLAQLDGFPECEARSSLADICNFVINRTY